MPKRPASRARRSCSLLLPLLAMTTVGLIQATASLAATPRRSGGLQPIAQGRTAAGTGYTISAEKGTGRFCRAAITINESAPDGQFGSAGCFSGFLSEQISVDCPGNRIAIEAIMPPTAHGIRVRLTDGRLLSSRAVALPARDGGPLSVYFQAVLASVATPVTLTELDARGHRLGRVHNLRAHGGSCVDGPPNGPTNEESPSTSAQP
jgi:hypothetical protein